MPKLSIWQKNKFARYSYLNVVVHLLALLFYNDYCYHENSLHIRLKEKRAARDKLWRLKLIFFCSIDTS